MTDPNAGETEQRDAQQGEQRPQPCGLALADRNGKCKRAKGFDGDSNAEGDAGQRVVETQVHHRQRGGKCARRQPRPAGEPAQPGADRHAQDDPRDKEPDEDGPDRAKCGEQTDRERGADLLADRGDDHH